MYSDNKVFKDCIYVTLIGKLFLKNPPIPTTNKQPSTN